MCRREKWAFSSYTNTKILPSPKPPSLYPVIWAWNTADFPLLLEGISPPGNYALAVWHCPSVSRKRDLFENSEPLNYCFFSHIKLWFPGSSSHTVLEPYKKQHCNWWKISFRLFFKFITADVSLLPVLSEEDCDWVTSLIQTLGMTCVTCGVTTYKVTSVKCITAAILALWFFASYSEGLFLLVSLSFGWSPGFGQCSGKIWSSACGLPAVGRVGKWSWGGAQHKEGLGESLRNAEKGISRDSEHVLVREQSENITSVQPPLFVNGEMLMKWKAGWKSWDIAEKWNSENGAKNTESCCMDQWETVTSSITCGLVGREGRVQGNMMKMIRGVKRLWKEEKKQKPTVCLREDLNHGRKDRKILKVVVLGGLLYFHGKQEEGNGQFSGQTGMSNKYTLSFCTDW